MLRLTRSALGDSLLGNLRPLSAPFFWGHGGMQASAALASAAGQAASSGHSQDATEVVIALGSNEVSCFTWNGPDPRQPPSWRHGLNGCAFAAADVGGQSAQHVVCAQAAAR